MEKCGCKGKRNAVKKRRRKDQTGGQRNQGKCSRIIELGLKKRDTRSRAEQTNGQTKKSKQIVDLTSYINRHDRHHKEFGVGSKFSQKPLKLNKLNHKSKIYDYKSRATHG